MAMLKFSVLRLSIEINKSLFCLQYASYYQGKVNTIAKRGLILKGFIANKDKRKNWHLELNSMKPKVRVFDKVHKPHRRKAVLNSLFISNITDVISTGDVAQDLDKFGIEITGVSISPCMKILNVFWQVPASKYDNCDDIGQMLAVAAPKIRAELISRNVLGRVPIICFLRDATNERISEYEMAVKKLESEPIDDTGVVADETFIEDLYSFKDSKKLTVEKEKITKLVEVSKKEVLATPYKPTDMRSDVCGLDHALLMDKVIALKKKKKDPLQHTNVINPDTLQSTDDLFSKIPGVCFQAGPCNETESRDAILKKFRIERKMLKEKNKDKSDDYQYYADNEADERELHFVEDSGDFIDDENIDNTR